MSDRYGRDDHDQLNGRKLLVEDWIVLDQMREESIVILNHALPDHKCYSLNKNDDVSLDSCRQSIRQLISKLDREEFAGAVFFAEEIESVLTQLIAQTVAHRDDALFVVGKGMQSLSRYLEQGQSSRYSFPVTLFPITLFPLLNDLRSLLGKSLLTETPLFLPHLAHLTSPADKDSLERVAELHIETITQLRQMYQIALVGFFKNPTNDERHRQLFQIFKQMEVICKGLPVGDIWPVSSALLRAVTAGGIESSISIRNLLRQLDSVLGVLINDGAETFNQRSEAFLKNALFYIADSNCDDDNTVRIKHRYSLGTDNIAQLKTTMIRVAGVLAEARNALQNYDIGAADRDHIVAQHQAGLRCAADALVVLGYPALRKSVLMQADAFSNIVDQSNIDQATVNKSALMNIISHLLSVEQQLGRLLTVHNGQCRGCEMVTDIEDDFRKKSLKHVETLNGFVRTFNEHPNSALTVSKNVRDALGILKQSEGIASLPPLLDLVLSMEKMVTTVDKTDTALISLLARGVLLLMDGIDYVAEEREGSPPLSGIAELQAEIESFTTRMASMVSTPLDTIPFDTMPFDTFVGKYSTQASAAVQSLRGWNRQPHDEVIKENHEMLLQLVREAKALQLNGCVTLAEPLADVYQAIRQQQPPVSDVVLRVLAVAHEHLIGVMARLAQQQPVAVSEELLERLQCLLMEMNNTNPAAVDECRSSSESAEAGYKVDDELLAIFLNEAMDNLDRATEALNLWLGNKNSQLLTILQCHLHTIKGGARMTGIGSIGDLAHGLEDLYEALSLKRLQVSSDLISLLMRGHDTLEDMLSAIRSHHPGIPVEKLCAEIRKVMESASTAPTFVPFPLSEQCSDPQTLAIGRIEAPVATCLSQETGHRTKGSSDSLVRVSSLLLDRMVDLTGETSTSFSSMEQRLEKSRRTLTEIDNTIHRLDKQLSRLSQEVHTQVSEDIEFGQLSKALAESVTDLTSLKDTLIRQNNISSSLLTQQINTHKEVQEGLIRTRMLPFDRMVPRLQRTVRKLARELDKPVELIIDKSEGEIDRTLMEQIIAPLEHILRNAIDHGIESTTAERLAKGKNKSGAIYISMVRGGDDICLTLSDDGQGINLDEIRDKAKQRGLISEESEISDAEAVALIFVPGISAAPCLTQISGRGVGMDVVKSTLESLGGQIDIHTESGKGTEFTIRLPCTISINRILMVTLGEEQYAVPLNTLEGVIQRPSSELREQYRSVRPQIKCDQQSYDLYYLGHLLHQNLSQLRNNKTEQSILLLSIDNRHVAVHVDAVLDSREVVVKGLGEQFANIKGVSGAITLGDSRVIAILELDELIREKPDNAPDGMATGAASVQKADYVADNEPDRNLVMIVDDSVTVRKVTGRLLKENGYRTVTARDGIEAMSLLREHRPSVILLDIEMPRMDGFQVATAVRSTPELQMTPIIMITSRTGDKHRQRALAIGVNNYIGKPFQDASLLEAVSTFTGDHSR